MYKFIGADGLTYGPVSAEQLKIWFGENRLNARTLVQAEGAQDWKPLSEFSEFAAELGRIPPISSSIPPTMTPIGSTLAARASNKVPAGVCGILLGSLGIHKFILGYNLAGALMLLVTVVGGLLTCGIASGVMHLVGLIEGIIYLCKPDEEFVRVYVDGKKEWF